MPEWLPTVVVIVLSVVGAVVFLWRMNVGQNKMIGDNGARIDVHDEKIKAVEEHIKDMNGSVKEMAKDVAELSNQMGRVETSQTQSHEDIRLIKTHLMGEPGEKAAGSQPA